MTFFFLYNCKLTLEISQTDQQYSTGNKE